MKRSIIHYIYTTILLVMTILQPVFGQKGGTAGGAVIELGEKLTLEGKTILLETPDIISSNGFSIKLNVGANGPLIEIPPQRNLVSGSTLDGQQWNWRPGQFVYLTADNPEYVDVPVNIISGTGFIKVTATLIYRGPQGQDEAVTYKLTKTLIASNKPLQGGNLVRSASLSYLVNGLTDTIYMTTASGGFTKSYRYQWQRLQTGGISAPTWVNIGGETNASLSPQKVITNSRYRRLAVSDSTIVTNAQLTAIGPEILVYALNRPAVTASKEYVTYNGTVILTGNGQDIISGGGRY